MQSEENNVFKSMTAVTTNKGTDRLESLEMVRTGYGPKILGAVMMVLLVVSSLAALFVPWRQSVVGSGKIIVFSPIERPQTIEATIIPGTEDRAAAIMIRDYDAPLLSIGNPVRLAISGWPSLQFVGWPSVAVGTFAGRIAVIDALDDGKYCYRIIVVPDYEAIAKKLEEPWPSVKYLRPGAKATGWVLLSNVPLWYELWRQFNGFQPTVPEPGTDNPTGESEPR